jgi:hypothetical protein
MSSNGTSNGGKDPLEIAHQINSKIMELESTSVEEEEYERALGEKILPLMKKSSFFFLLSY